MSARRRIAACVWLMILLAPSCAPDAVLVPEPELLPPCSSQYTTIPAGECDLYLQDCEDPSQRCIPFNTGSGHSTKCSPSFGGKQAGAPCIGIAECDTGLTCGAGFCVPVCCPETHVPCEDGFCIATQSLGGGNYVRRCVYSEPCELFTDGCGQDRCYAVPELGVTLCLPATAAQGEGAVCDAYSDCQSSQMCYRAVESAPGICRHNCLLDGSATEPGEGGCPPDRQCNAFGFADPAIGVCVP